MIERIISGGQTGADRGGLRAAHVAGVAMGGRCPAGRRAEDGCIPAHYPLQETTSSGYRARTALNVEGADGTVVFIRGFLTPGCRLTTEVAAELGKPWMLIDLVGITPKGAAERLLRWARTHDVGTLNVAGTRESKAPGIEAVVQQIIYTVLIRQHEEGPGYCDECGAGLEVGSNAALTDHEGLLLCAACLPKGGGHD